MNTPEKTPAVEKFIEGINDLLTDDRFREVLRDLDEEEQGEVAGLLARDPSGYLEERGVQIPEDFRVSAHQHFDEAARQSRTTRYCLRICAWHWCVEICVSKTTTTSRQ